MSKFCFKAFYIGTCISQYIYALHLYGDHKHLKGIFNSIKSDPRVIALYGGLW